MEKATKISIILFSTIIILMIIFFYWDYNTYDFLGMKESRENFFQFKIEADNVCKHFGFDKSTTQIKFLTGQEINIECDDKETIRNVIIDEILECFQYNKNGACIDGKYIFKYQNNTGGIIN